MEVEVLLYIADLDEQIEEVAEIAEVGEKYKAAFKALAPYKTDIGEVELYLTVSVEREDYDQHSWAIKDVKVWVHSKGKKEKLPQEVVLSLMEYYDEPEQREDVWETVNDELSQQE